jgi:hypothetical protein
VKRTVLILFIVSLLGLAAAYFFQPDTSIDYSTFEPRFSAAFRSADFHAVERASCSGEQVPFPLTLRPHRRPSTGDPRIHLGIGFPDSADHYKLATDSLPPLDCFVRYFDGRAAFIAIRAHSSQASVARALQSALAREFPGFTITLNTNDA